jgi:hypothetical protein
MKIREISEEAWRAEAIAKFGPDPLDWKFVCPACGHIAAVRDWQNLGATEGMVAFSCVGRHMDARRDAFVGTGPGPCNYAGGGLFRINPVKVGDRDSRIFEFADAA